MSLQKSSVPVQNTKTNPKPQTPMSDADKVLGGVREVMETLAIAFVLAFLFKIFEGELYVIPTGSMAPTLMGRHKDVVCPECGCPYQVSASEEFEPGTNASVSSNRHVLAGTCPQCRYTNYFGSNNPEKKVYPSYKGDHILVNKYIMDFRRPKRWDVTVFRFPGEPRINYIKRLIGQENETVQIHNGNVYVRKEGEDRFEVARKNAGALLSMLQLVHSTDYENHTLIEAGVPPRWSQNPNEPLAWETTDYKSYFTRPSDSVSWLRYQHRLPSSEDWSEIKRGTYSPDSMPIPPQLIADFTSYNTSITHSADAKDYYGYENAGARIKTRTVKTDGKETVQFLCSPIALDLGVNWVSDLALECELTVEKPQGVFTMELVRSGFRFLCEIDLATGQAVLSAPEGPESFKTVTADTPLGKTGTWKLMFANVDDQLRLFVGANEIEFENHGIYSIDPLLPPTQRDLTPASLGVKKAQVKVEHLTLKRDIYYIASNIHTKRELIDCDLLEQPYFPGLTELELRRLMSDSSLWQGFGKTRTIEFPLKKGEFLLLGDNSAKSKDSRLWEKSMFPGDDFEYYVVPEKHLVGEALFVYWPHGFRFPGTGLNIVPNLSKMRFIK